MGSQHHMKTGNFLTFWVRINQLFLLFSVCFSPFLSFRESLLPTGFKRGWSRKVRIVENVAKVQNVDVSARYCSSLLVYRPFWTGISPVFINFPDQKGRKGAYNP